MLITICIFLNPILLIHNLKFWLSTLFMDIPPQDVLGRGGFWGGF
jgi:hypothetical protein